MDVPRKQDAFTDERIRCGAQSGGLHLSPVRIVIAVLSAICFALTVGLIVFFSSRQVCTVKFDKDLPVGDGMGVRTCSPQTELSGDRPTYSQSFTQYYGSPDTSGSTYYIMDDNLRLPTTLQPQHYTLTVRPDIYHSSPEDFNLQGHVDIELTVLQSTSSIVMHKRTLTVVESTLVVMDTSDSSELPWVQTRENPTTEFYIIDLAQALEVGTTIIVSMDYFGPLLNDMAGAFYTPYQEDGQTEYLVATQFAAIEARKTFPCLDQPDLKSTFQLNVWRKAPYVGVSNMPIEVMKVEGEWRVDSFERTNVVMSTYLVAFGVAKYSTITAESDTELNAEIGIWGRPSRIADGQGDYALSVAGPILAYYEDYFDETYLLPKNDHFGINDLPYGAMENWGLVVYREERLLVNPDFDTTSDFYGQTSIIAHEIAHMWVGNIVTCAWWNDMFLNEGFASFYDYYGAEHAQPDWDLEQIYVYDSMRGIMSDDSQGTAPALTAPIETLADIGTVYNGLNYAKGAGVIRMMSEVMGLNVFRSAMQEYINRFAYSSATHTDLLDVMDEIAIEEDLQLPVTVTELMRPFLRQAGFPLVTIDTTTGVTSQELYLEAPWKGHQLPPSEYDYRWHVPFTYTASWAPDDEVYFWIPIDAPTTNIQATRSTANSWMIGNARYIGYYMVNYDIGNWNAIIDQINTAHTVINVINRCQLLHDSFKLTRAEYLPQLVGLELTEYLVHEQDYIPFACLEDNLHFLDHILSSDSINSDYRTYMMNMITPSYDRLGWDMNDNMPLFDLYHRSLSIDLACYYGNTACHAEAVTRFDLWVVDPANRQTIDPDDRANVYCYGLMHHGDHVTMWDTVLDIYVSEVNAGEQLNLRDALTCSEDGDILENLFDMCTGDDPSDIRSSDESSIVGKLSRKSLMRDYVWNKLDTEWDTINHRETAMTAIVETFSTQEDIDMLDAFITEHPAESPSEEDYYDNLQVDLDANYRWRENNYDDIVGWLPNAVDRQRA